MLVRKLCLYKHSVNLPTSLRFNVNKVKLPHRTISNFNRLNYVHHNITYNSILTRKLHDTKRTVNEVHAKSSCNTFTYRTHTCGELRPEHDGLNVTLCGWVQYSRLSKFILLRDSYGITQCIINGSDIKLTDIPLETVIKVDGTVVLRPENMINPNMITGEIEVVIENIKVLNVVDKLPFNLRDYQKPKEQLRLQHRYIDLRFPEMQSNLRQRSSMLHNMRRFLVEKHGFVEVETPTLFCRTPGGAREFVVPTHHSGLFYSLVQSPQQFKQMLMSGGIDRYFQVARCYRDETTRPDRQPEFTQLDIELSFTNLDGVITMIEQLMYDTFSKPLLRPPFKRITYTEALESYGCDKPNLSNGLKFINIKHVFSETVDENFRAFAMPYPLELGKLTSKYKDSIREIIKKYSNKVILHENLTKELGIELTSKIQEIIGHENSAIISLGNNDNACLCLGEIRDLILSLLKSKNLLTVNENVEPLWVVDFPLFVEGENGLVPCHHPFTAPHPEDLHLLDTDPLKVRSLAYDIVMNGYEIGGGSVRVHNVELQEKLMKMLDIDPAKLTHFLNALRSGCPPHAGIALGIDRLVTVACNAESIREVIAFPKSHDGRDPLSGAPNVISEEDKKYYHITNV